MSKEQSKLVKFLSGKGFYVALAICLVGAGASAWVAVDRSIHNITEQDPASYLSSRSSISSALSSSSSPISEEVGKEQSGVSKPSQPDSSEEPESSSSQASQPAQESGQPTGTAPSDVQRISYILPLEGEILNPYSGGELVKSKTLGDWRTHDGVDIKAKAATPVVAVAAGTVESIENDPMFGTTITVLHSNGVSSIYASLNEKVNVSEGQQVAAGDVLGSVGETAIAEIALETHLHFAMTKDGQYLDPMSEIEESQS